MSKTRNVLSQQSLFWLKLLLFQHRSGVKTIVKYMAHVSVLENRQAAAAIHVKVPTQRVTNRSHLECKL